MQSETDGISAVVRDCILEALSGIRFGAVEVLVHDGKVAGIERRERMRLERE